MARKKKTEAEAATDTAEVEQVETQQAEETPESVEVAPARRRVSGQELAGMLRQERRERRLRERGY